LIQNIIKLKLGIYLTLGWKMQLSFIAYFYTQKMRMEILKQKTKINSQKSMESCQNRV
jgi:hypothetical protein